MQGLAEKEKGLIGRVEKGELAKVVVDFEARLKDLKSKLEESELWATKEREANK